MPKHSDLNPQAKGRAEREILRMQKELHAMPGYEEALHEASRAFAKVAAQITVDYGMNPVEAMRYLARAISTDFMSAKLVQAAADRMFMEAHGA